MELAGNTHTESEREIYIDTHTHTQRGRERERHTYRERERERERGSQIQKMSFWAKSLSNTNDDTAIRGGGSRGDGVTCTGHGSIHKRLQWLVGPGHW